MSSRLCVWLVLLAFGPAAATAQDITKELSEATKRTSKEIKGRYKLQAIEVTGNERYPDDQIVAASGLRLGEEVIPADFQRALNRLSDTGVFENLAFRYRPERGGYKLIFEVEEVSEVYPLALAGFEVPDEQLLSLLEERIPMFTAQVPPTGPMVREIGRVLQSFWEEQGNDSEVEGSLELLEGDQFEMLFQPQGTRTTIAFTRFENSGILPAPEVARVFNQAAIGEVYSERRLLELLKFNVKPLYEEKGYLEVEFCPCTAEPDEQTKGVLVTIPVRPGAPYTFGGIELPRDVPIDPETLLGLMKPAEGDPAAMGEVKASLVQIEELLQTNGYLKASASFERALDTEKKTVDIHVSVQAGDRYTLNKLTIRGLDLDGEAAVRKRWIMNFGDPFNANYPRIFLSRITREGMFDNLKKTDFKISLDEERKTADVELTFN